MAGFYVAITGNFERLRHWALTLKQVFWKTKTFLKTCKVLRSEYYEYFYTRLACQKPMLRQIECGVQNEPITKNGLHWILHFLEI